MGSLGVQPLTSINFVSAMMQMARQGPETKLIGFQGEGCLRSESWDSVEGAGKWQRKELRLPYDPIVHLGILTTSQKSWTLYQ